MCCAPEELDLNARKCSCSDKRAVVVDAGGRYEGDIDAFISTCLQQTNLAPSDALFSRGAKDEDLARQIVVSDHLGCCNASSQRSHSNEIVSARMAQLGESICIDSVNHCSSAL